MFNDAEWGFAFAAEYWGTQVFTEAARLVIEFSVSTLGVHRLEARVAVRNGRGNGALRKLGAVQEGLLRRSFLRGGEYLDQVLWTIFAEDWNPRRTLSNPPAH
jgi:RimJ/RimL family protein N-acetyltransferase